VFGRAFFKSKCLAGRVSRSGLGVADEFAKIKEMLLGGGAFRQVNLAPLGDKFLGGHGNVTNEASFSRIGMADEFAREIGQRQFCVRLSAMPMKVESSRQVRPANKCRWTKKIAFGWRAVAMRKEYQFIS
jgi:hypothetical protein